MMESEKQMAEALNDAAEKFSSLARALQKSGLWEDAVFADQASERALDAISRAEAIRRSTK